MRFTDQLFQNIEHKRWDVTDFLERLKKEEIIVWGTGLAGNMIYEALEKRQIPVSCFADNNTKKIGTSIWGKKVLGIEEISQNAFVVIGANVRYQIHEQLRSRGINYQYIDPVWLYSYGERDIVAVLKKNAASIDRVYYMLMSEASKKVYRNVLLHRAVHNIDLIWEVYDEYQYFGNTIVKKAGLNFVDCGAYQGDTLTHFLEQLERNETYHYYAFEADRNNYEILKKFCEERNLNTVKPINLGVWDKQGELCFQENQTTGEVSGRIVENDGTGVNVVKVDSLDAVLGNEKVDFIKMDIEGAEINALWGAERCIKRNKPTLAISAYHKLEHLWEIPLLIKEMNEKYDLYFGQHMWNMADSVCYGIYHA